MSNGGGSIESVSLAGRRFSVAADAEVQRKLGGREVEVQANGDGTARPIKTRVPWSLEGLMLNIDDDRGDHEYLQGLTERNDFFPVSVTFATGSVYQGVGQITGELQTSSQNGVASVSLMGPGNLTPQ